MQQWRRGWDSNPRYGLKPYNGLANRRLQPLGHPSKEVLIFTLILRPLSTPENHLIQKENPKKAENLF